MLDQAYQLIFDELNQGVDGHPLKGPVPTDSDTGTQPCRNGSLLFS